MVSETATSVRPAETWMSDSVKLAPGASENAKVTTELVSPTFSAPSTMLTTTVGFAVLLPPVPEPTPPTLRAVLTNKVGSAKLEFELGRNSWESSGSGPGASCRSGVFSGSTDSLLKYAPDAGADGAGGAPGSVAIENNVANS